MQIFDSISFPEAISVTESLLVDLEVSQLNAQEIEKAIASLVKSYNGARGFFVTYLTSDSQIPDRPSEEVISGLKTSVTIVTDLLVKNLAMSTAMAIEHRRGDRQDLALQSERVTRRTANLIKLLNLTSIFEQLNKLKASCLDREQSYQEFLQRWNYDREQKNAIVEAISQLID
jgi:hypothetical protein